MQLIQSIPTKSAEEFQPKDHTEPRERVYACKYCGKTFPYSWKLTNHIRTHTGEKPFKCTVCNQCFADSSNLKRHMDIHTGGSYKCTECGQRFPRSCGQLY
ncbi:hypothetical protein CEXT_799731 [Caerostris extrusa]|uniref:C2H2-type domain-containing protein n=1 Tax=Caerostris extrusa TaxID=172846 RepID=A0AAV4PXX3_CAEEX|nr:hypothetical protein CEXT_799731 [Caerostris extrusa]